jgi:hypothetical protein
MIEATPANRVVAVETPPTLPQTGIERSTPLKPFVGI